MTRSRSRAAWGTIALLLLSCSPDDDADPSGVAATVQGPCLHAVLPSVAVAGRAVSLRVSPLDDLGRPDTTWRDRLSIEGTGFETRASFHATGEGALVLPDVVFTTPGIHRIRVKSAGGMQAIAGPVRVVASEEDLRPRPGAEALHILWGDCHGHSTIGDGTHPAENYFFYGREIAHLDYTCLSEHDYQQFLDVGFDAQEQSWEAATALARTWRRPGFAVLTGWEWSSRVHGHRVVLFPDDESRYVSYRKVSTPAELARALEGTGAFSVIAHPTGSQLTPAVQWSTVVPGFDRAIEIYSGHGAMGPDADYRPTSGPKAGATAVDAIRRGFRFAFVGFSDTHLTTPGNPVPTPIRDAPYRGGLTAVWAPSASERDIFEAIRDGHCYATSGERFFVEFHVEDRVPGETLELDRGARVAVSALVAAPGDMQSVELMVGDRTEKRIDGHGRSEIEISERIGPFEGETALWLRGASTNGERFWTTPVWVWERAP